MELNMIKLIAGPSHDEREIILDIPEEVKNVGLNMGGGVDSSLLLHLLTKYFPKRHFKVFTLDKLNEPIHAQRVIRALGVEDRITHVVKPFVDTGESQAYGFLTREIFFRKEVDFLFTGSNAVPEPGILDESVYKPPRRRTENARPGRMGLPFLHVLKYHTVDLYYREGIDHILPLTHSCTEVADGSDEICWWCQERQWAFNVLGKDYIRGK